MYTICGSGIWIWLSWILSSGSHEVQGLGQQSSYLDAVYLEVALPFLVAGFKCRVVEADEILKEEPLFYR